MSVPLLSVEGLCLSYQADGRPVQALRDVSLEAQRGEIVGIVGESGCGKSTLAAALIGLLPEGARIEGGRIRLEGDDLLALPEAMRRQLRGPGIAMVFQDPMTSFSPVLRVGEQLADFQYNLAGVSRRDKRARALAMLRKVGVSDPERCLDRYPHELSGGMRQRAAVAAALLMSPTILVADEPTTALDVTMEAQILHLLRELREESGGAIVIITHHLGVIGEVCDRVYVMYAGEVVEEGTVDEIYYAPRHPYTRALIACDPGHLAVRTRVLPTIPGRPPHLSPPPAACSFAPRCPLASERCRTLRPPRVRVSPTQAALCHAALA